MTTQIPARNIRIAVLYSEADVEFWNELERHVGLIARMHSNVRIWTVQDAELGSVVRQEIRDELRRADITLLLLSADFAIEEVFDAETRILLDAYAEQQSGKRFIMPVIVKDFLWQDHYDDHFDIERLKFVDRLPQNPEEREAVYKEITEMLSRYIEEINARSIHMVIPTWVGYIGGILYNNGFNKSKDTSLFQKFRRQLRFSLEDDISAVSESVTGGEADLVWATLDRLPSVVNRLKEYNPKVIFQASWSNGADCVIARNGIEEVADLKGKKVIYPYDSPALTFLRYVLKEAQMDAFDIVHQPQRQANLDAVSRAFIRDQSIDAVVIWSPYAEACLEEVKEAKIIVDSRRYPNLIADVLVAPAEFVELNRDELAAIFQGWLEVTQSIQQDPAERKQALEVLVDAIIEPLPSIIPSKIRKSLVKSLRSYFSQSLDKVHLCSLSDNQRFFGLDEQAAQADGLYREFLKLQYPEFLYEPSMQWSELADASVVERLLTLKTATAD